KLRTTGSSSTTRMQRASPVDIARPLPAGLSIENLSIENLNDKLIPSLLTKIRCPGAMCHRVTYPPDPTVEHGYSALSSVASDTWSGIISRHAADHSTLLQ